MSWTGSVEESRELLDLAQEAGHVGIFEWHVRDGTVRLSPQSTTLYGLSKFDGCYESWLSCIFREDQIRFSNILETAFGDHQREISAEFRINRSVDGTLRWIEVRTVVFYDPEGQPVRVVGVAVDVT